MLGEALAPVDTALDATGVPLEVVHEAARADTPGRATDHRAAVRRKARRSTQAMLRRDRKDPPVHQIARRPFRTVQRRRCRR